MSASNAASHSMVFLLGDNCIRPTWEVAGGPRVLDEWVLVYSSRLPMQIARLPRVVSTLYIMIRATGSRILAHKAMLY